LHLAAMLGRKGKHSWFLVTSIYKILCLYWYLWNIICYAYALFLRRNVLSIKYRSNYYQSINVAFIYSELN